MVPMIKIVIEGADGCGKTTIAQLLGKAIGAQVVHFPNDDSVTGPMIRSYLRRGWHTAGEEDVEENGPIAFQCLQVANRLETLHKLDPGRPFVFARHWQSGWVYGQIDGLDADWLRDLHLGMMADYHFLLDLEPAVSMQRRASRDGELPPERYEGRLGMATRTTDLYRELWNNPPHRTGHGGLWQAIDASAPAAEVLASILAKLPSGMVSREVTR